jgi:hypothetical protein
LVQTRGVDCVLHVLMVDEQSEHEAPLEPQRESKKPAKHTLFWQQPTQFCALHCCMGGMHLPPAQT